MLLYKVLLCNDLRDGWWTPLFRTDLGEGPITGIRYIRTWVVTGVSRTMSRPIPGTDDLGLTFEVGVGSGKPTMEGTHGSLRVILDDYTPVGKEVYRTSTTRGILG